MEKSVLHNKGGLKNRRKKHIHVRREINGEIRSEVEAFLMTSGLGSVYKLMTAFDKLHIPPHTIRAIVKDVIRKDIKRFNEEADTSDVALKNNHYTTLANFDSAGFIARRWQYVPFVLRKHDYFEIQRKKKYPIYIQKYDYSKPLYDFTNNIKFENEGKFKRRNIENSNDVQFYISSDEKMLFAKVTNLNFVPANPLLLREYKKLHPAKEEQAKLIYMPNLFDRSFSISMYVMLEGDPKKTHMYMRYDSSSKTHKNVYIGPDKREKVFGYETGNPHFHFQNEDDNLLCMKKYRDEHRQIKWKTGRCNAIDIKHLINYLTELDNMPEEKISNLYYEGTNYNMPFLEAKYNSRTYYTKSIGSIISSYKNSDVSQEFIKTLVEKFNILNPEQDSTNKVFCRLIKSLKFLQFIYDERINTNDLNELEALSQLEIIVANDVMNSITNSRDRIAQKDSKTKYVLNGSYLLKKEHRRKKTLPKNKDFVARDTTERYTQSQEVE